MKRIIAVIVAIMTPVWILPVGIAFIVFMLREAVIALYKDIHHFLFGTYP